MLPSYTHDFLTVAEQHVAAAQAKGVDGEVDAMIAIIALQNAVVGATKILGRGHPAVKGCLSESPDLKDVRDMLTHFDEYAVGGGRLQAPEGGGDGAFGWLPMWNAPGTLSILNRRRGDELPTEYRVTVADALRSVAALVGAADASLGLPRSSVVARLAAQDS